MQQHQVLLRYLSQESILKAKPISAATACGLSNVEKVIHEIVLQSYNKNKKQYLQTIRSFDKIYRKRLQDNHNLFDKKEKNLCVIFLPSIWMKQKLNLCYKYEHKYEIKSFH